MGSMAPGRRGEYLEHGAIQGSNGAWGHWPQDAGGNTSSMGLSRVAMEHGVNGPRTPGGIPRAWGYPGKQWSMGSLAPGRRGEYLEHGAIQGSNGAWGQWPPDAGGNTSSMGLSRVSMEHGVTGPRTPGGIPRAWGY